MRSGTVTFALLALAAATACETPTAPSIFVYADRPIDVPAASKGWKTVSVGGSHSCALRLDGTLYCWGGNASAQLGLGEARGQCGARKVPCEAGPRAAQTTQRFSSVRAGQRHSCAISLNRQLFCWGENLQFATGVQAEVYVTKPMAVLPELQFIDVGPGMTHSCAVRTNGTVYCWEANGFAQLGDGTTNSTAIPSPVASAERFSSVSTGIIQSCGTALDGRAYCWGNNSFGQLGVPRPGDRCGFSSLECSLQPIGVFGFQRFDEVATGFGTHTCGITVETSILCWGLGSEGQLGDGYIRDRQSLPVGVLAPAP